MASRTAHRVFFTFLLSEEEAARDKARAALYRLQQLNKESVRSGEEDAAAPHTDGHKAAVQRDQPPAKRRRKGGRCTEDYLQKGGMVAFYDLSDFSNHFGMTRTQVEELLGELQPHYPYERGSKLPLENVVLASLWVLSSQESYRTIAERFQTSKSVICSSLHTFCSLVSGNLENHIRWPVGNAVQGTLRGFEEIGFPGTLGAVDAFHIPISKPKDVQEPSEYMKEKATYCTTLLAACDPKYKFTYVSVGHPGALTAWEVFRRCDLHKAFEEDASALLPHDFQIGDEVYPYHIIADAGFPLSEYVMTPYVDNGHLNIEELEYNRQHSSALSTLTKAVGVLRARYSRLNLLQMQHLAQCSIAIKACCILHNLCVQVDDVYAYDVSDVFSLNITNTSDLHLKIESDGEGEHKRRAVVDFLF